MKQTCKHKSNTLAARRSALFLALLLFSALFLSGCQLAVEETAEAPGRQDRLIGALLTETYLNLSNCPNERLYAVYQDDTYVFEGIEGALFCAPTQTNANGELMHSVINRTFYEITSQFIASDTAARQEHTATLYLLPRPGIFTCVVNPVYQAEDESVYLVSGSSYGVASPDGSDNWRFSTELTEEVTVTENGETRTDSFSLALSFVVQPAPEQIALFQMDADHRILSTREYIPGQLPETLPLSPDTAYLLVESSRADSRQGTLVTRQLLEPGTETLHTFYPLDSQICAVQATTLVWNH